MLRTSIFGQSLLYHNGKRQFSCNWCFIFYGHSSHPFFSPCTKSHFWLDFKGHHASLIPAKAKPPHWCCFARFVHEQAPIFRRKAPLHLLFQLLCEIVLGIPDLNTAFRAYQSLSTMLKITIIQNPGSSCVPMLYSLYASMKTFHTLKPSSTAYQGFILVGNLSCVQAISCRTVHHNMRPWINS